MPSKGEVELFRLCSKYAANCYVIGIDINPTTGKISPTKSKFKLIIHYLVTTSAVIIAGFCLYRNYVTFKARTSTTANGLEIIYMFVSIGRGVVAPWFIFYALYKEEFTSLWNELFEHCLKGKFSNTVM